MKFEIKSKYNLQETLTKVKTSLKSNGFGTLFELNFKDKFKEHDMEYPNNYYVLEVCSPKFAKKILDISQDIGYFLPCKVVVYEDGDDVIIGMMKPTAMLHMVTSDKQAVEIARQVEQIIIKSFEL